MPSAPAGPVEVMLSDANGTMLCGSLGRLRGHGHLRTAHGRVGGASIAIKMTDRNGGAVTIAGRNVDLAGLDQPTVGVAVQLGGDRFFGGGAFHQHGSRRWVFP